MSLQSSQEVISLAAQLDISHQALLSVVAEHPPYGFVHLDDGTTSHEINETRIRLSHYLEALSYCGNVSPGQGGYPEDYATVDEFSRQVGETYLGGLGALLLAKSVTHKSADIRGVDISGLRYQSTYGERLMESGFDSGFMAMGMLAHRGFEAIEDSGEAISNEDKRAVLEASYRFLPVGFANMKNGDNKKTEILYGIRVSGSYGKDSALYELGLPEDVAYGFTFTGTEVKPVGFDELKERVSRKPHCGAMQHPVFKDAWRIISSNTVTLMNEASYGK